MRNDNACMICEKAMHSRKSQESFHIYILLHGLEYIVYSVISTLESTLKRLASDILKGLQ